ncbi:Cupin 2 conserved barrel [Penicillium herquei]|nr:Cupin 2 conserved barrel [Penicillium herquei]
MSHNEEFAAAMEKHEGTALRPFTRYITGHNAEGKAVLHSSGEVPNSFKGQFAPGETRPMAFNVAYTTSEFPANLNNDADLAAHENVIQSGNLGLVNPNGTVFRIVDFPPDTPAAVHRTQSLDYGIVLEGQVEMILEEGEPVLLQRGDVAIQRATMHGWRNPSKTEWTRMAFILQDCKPLEVGGTRLKEDLGPLGGVLKSSGNDQ